MVIIGNLKKTVDIKLIVEGETALTDEIRSIISNYYDPVCPKRLSEVWEKQVPPREKLSIEVYGTCISMMDDWVCTIFGSSYTDCIRAISVLHNLLINELQKQVTFKPLSQEVGTRTLDKLLSSERRRRRIKGAAKWIILSLVSAGIGYGLGLLGS